jgi:hypothetical protein
MPESKKMPIATRNAMFLAFYNNIKESEEWKNLKPHKRIKYLQSEFHRQENIIMPIGTIYKLIKPKQTDNLSQKVEEESPSEETPITV